MLVLPSEGRSKNYNIESTKATVLEITVAWVAVIGIYEMTYTLLYYSYEYGYTRSILIGHTEWLFEIVLKGNKIKSTNQP